MSKSIPNKLLSILVNHREINEIKTYNFLNNHVYLIDINETYLKRTALLFVLEYQKINVYDVFKILIEHGANVNISDNYSRTPL